MRIYIVEDDADIRGMMTYALRNSGYEVEGFGDGKSFFEAVGARTPDLVLLDILLPGEDGLSLLSALRARPETKDLPIMMVTAKTTELDKVTGLDMGADDYLTKPFGIMELVSRVKALLRRTAPKEQAQVYRCGDVELDDSRHAVTVGGEPCILTYKEYELLKFLLINQDIVVSREKIISHVWGFDYGGESRTVDMHVKTLRQKLGESGALIKTVRNVGYSLESDRT